MLVSNVVCLTIANLFCLQAGVDIGVVGLDYSGLECGDGNMSASH